MTSARTKKIRDLNDAFRTTLIGGEKLLTAEAVAIGPEFVAAALAAVRSFNTFTIDNDPYGEHDFGCVTVGEEKVFWKIDYYDTTLCYGSNDPADPAQTTRVLTIMLAHEY
ncbi:MAG TPA: DUF3768 domain-containing protein [Rhizomicrobium sp.]|jgi:hypothetical protein